MSEQNGTATAPVTNVDMPEVGADKGKGKATEPVSQDIEMGEDENDSSSDEEEEETEAPVVEEEDEDNMEEIDTGNILDGRTRQRRNVDYVKAAEQLPEGEDDEDDDDDFEPADDAMED